MSWVQWTLVAHGGALAAEPDLVRRLKDLNRVLEERSRGLNSLLTLKGKLDMLEAQMQLRRGNRMRRSGASRNRGGSDGEAEEDEEGVIYVEGEEDEPLTNGLAGSPKGAGEADEFPIANGAEDSEDDSEDDEELKIDEPDVTDGESLGEGEVDHDDFDESEEEDDSDIGGAAPPAKVQKTSKIFPKGK